MKKKIIIFEYTIIGILFGICFPIGAITLESILKDIPLNLKNILTLHQQNKLLLMIDTAPLFLGLFSLFGGISKAKLVEVHNTLLKNIHNEAEMKNKLEDIISESKTIIDTLVNISQELSIESLNSENYTKKISKDVNLIDEYSKINKDSLQSINSLVSMINELTQGIKQDIQLAFTSIIEVKDSISSTQIESNKLYDLSKSMHEKIEESSNQFNNFLEKFNFIIKLISNIDDIGRRIQILSLNSSVEASRVGTYGKAFEVISNDIRNLSVQTNRISNQIGKSILEVQKSMTSIQDNNNKDCQKILQIHSFTTQLNEMINNNIVKINTSSNKMTDVLNKSKDQEELYSNIHNQVHNSNYMANDIVSTTGNINSGMNKQLVISDKLSNIVVQINKKTISLENVVGK